jgi:hypothetical protein
LVGELNRLRAGSDPTVLESAIEMASACGLNVAPAIATLALLRRTEELRTILFQPTVSLGRWLCVVTSFVGPTVGRGAFAERHR